MNDAIESNTIAPKELTSEAIEKLVGSIEKLNSSLTSLDENSTRYALVMERITWVLVLIALIQLVLPFFSILTYPGWARFLILIIIAVALVYFAKKITEKTS